MAWVCAGGEGRARRVRHCLSGRRVCGMGVLVGRGELEGLGII